MPFNASNQDKKSFCDWGWVNIIFTAYIKPPLGRVMYLFPTDQFATVLHSITNFPQSTVTGSNYSGRVTIKWSDTSWTRILAMHPADLPQQVFIPLSNREQKERSLKPVQHPWEHCAPSSSCGCRHPQRKPEVRSLQKILLQSYQSFRSSLQLPEYDKSGLQKNY